MDGGKTCVWMEVERELPPHARVKDTARKAKRIGNVERTRIASVRNRESFIGQASPGEKACVLNVGSTATLDVG